MLRILHGIVIATIESKIVWETTFAGQTLTKMLSKRKRWPKPYLWNAYHATLL